MQLLSPRLLRACVLSLTALAPLTVAADDAANALSLQQAIAAALQNNPALQTFEFQLRAQDARAQQAAQRQSPALSLEIENFAGRGERKNLDAAEATLALSQVIELGGKRQARILAAEAGRSALQLERQAAQLDLLAEVARRFVHVAQAQQQLQLSRSAVSLAGKTVSASERRVAAAKAPHAELDRARIALDRARLQQGAAALALETARTQLAATWGAAQPLLNGQPFGEVRANLFALPPTGDFAQLASQLVSNPDLQRFASEARLRDAELRMARTLRRPDITLGAGIRRFEETQDQAVVASLSLPLFSGQRAESRVAEAEAHRAQLDTERRAAEVTAEATLYQLHRQLSRAVTQAQTLRDDIQPRSAEALRETEYAYARGRYSYLELVDAQREYLAVQADLIDAAAAAHLLRTEIERLTNAPLNPAAPSALPPIQ